MHLSEGCIFFGVRAMAQTENLTAVGLGCALYVLKLCLTCLRECFVTLLATERFLINVVVSMVYIMFL